MENKHDQHVLTFAIDGQEIFSKTNPSPESLKRMKIFFSYEWNTAASGKVEHFMLTSPSCESKAPTGWDKKEVNWNTFIYYKKFDEKTKADAKNFCRDKGEAYYLSLDPRIWVFSKDSLQLLVLAMNHGP